MAFMNRDGISIRYEECGSGFPVLLLAPGAMEATVEAWKQAPIDPLGTLDGDYRLIAMDHRNAGQSKGDLDFNDPWGAYVRDQVLLLDYLDIERAHVLGCCIGVSFALKMAHIAPDRVVSMVLEQPIGITTENKDHWTNRRKEWAGRRLAGGSGFEASALERFGAAMWDNGEFVVSVTREQVRSCSSPMLILPGSDLAHPRDVGLEIAGLAQDVELLEPWKGTPELIAKAVQQIREFLRRHTPWEG